MDDRRPLGSVHHYYFEQVSGPVGTEEEVAGRVRGDLLNDHGVAYGVLGVGHVDVVAERRPESIHPGIVLQNPYADRPAVTGGSAEGDGGLPSTLADGRPRGPR